MTLPSVRRLVLSVLVVVFTVGAHEHDDRKKEAARPGEKVIWLDPGDPSQFDFQYGAAGSERQPQAPFSFVNEDLSRTTPKINVVDSRGVAWNVKWGEEASPSVFCTRLTSACGYLAEPEYFVAKGRIDKVRNLSRARRYVAKDGSFVNARFQLRTDSPKYLQGEYWPLDKNHFLGSPEFQGMRILMLLVSNWDKRDSNFGIFEDVSAGTPRYLYVQTDWGASLGSYGNAFTRSKWHCRDFADQTEGFVKGVDRDRMKWGFGDWNDIRVSDVRWLLQYLGKITDTQIRLGLSTSGATPDEVDCFTEALRDRIEQLQRAAGVQTSAVEVRVNVDKAAGLAR
jgi:hypothetical protein